MKPVPFFERFSFKIVAGLISMLFLVGAPFFFVFLRYHRNQLLEAMETLTTNMSRILTHQIEISVLEGRQHDMERVVQRLWAGGDVRTIMVINPEGKVVVSSDRSQLGRVLSRHEEPGCRECHISVVLKETIYLTDKKGQPYYRNVNVIQNRPACMPCHNSRSSINGILVMDFSQVNLQSRVRSSLIWFLTIGGAMLALTIAVLYLLLNHIVLRPLKKFTKAAEEIGPNRFGQVALSGSDEFSQLANSFNSMSRRLEAAMGEVRGTRDYLESVINSTDDEIIVMNRDFRIITANAAHHRNARNGRPAAPAGDEGAGTPTDTECHSPEDCACANTFRDGQVHKVLQNTPAADGQERFIEVICSPMRNEAGEIHQAIEVRRDITERKLLEANLAHSERLISMGLLASGLSHEINNPLASISTFVEGLKRRLKRTAGADHGGLQGLDDSLDLIQREIERAKDVTRRLLILAQKDESGPSLVDMNESMQETVRLLRYEAAKLGIQMDFEPGSGLPVLKIFESQVRQVFLNLLLNSLQACSPGGHIRCRTWCGSGRVFAAVEDDGCGIQAPDLRKIFEPFFTRKLPGRGTGLGLFICKSIVSSWGGDISVESKPLEGARFTVWLPIQS